MEGVTVSSTRGALSSVITELGTVWCVCEVRGEILLLSLALSFSGEEP